MRSLRAVALVGTVLAIALIGAPAASAAIEVGDDCVGNAAGGPYSAGPGGACSSGGPLPLAAPTGGVVTALEGQLGAHRDAVPECHGGLPARPAKPARSK